jgi:hypothetical protein
VVRLTDPLPRPAVEVWTVKVFAALVATAVEGADSKTKLLLL